MCVCFCCFLFYLCSFFKKKRKEMKSKQRHKHWTKQKCAKEDKKISNTSGLFVIMRVNSKKNECRFFVLPFSNSLFHIFHISFVSSCSILFALELDALALLHPYIVYNDYILFCAGKSWIIFRMYVEIVEIVSTICG